MAQSRLVHQCTWVDCSVHRSAREGSLSVSDDGLSYPCGSAPVKLAASSSRPALWVQGNCRSGDTRTHYVAEDSADHRCAAATVQGHKACGPREQKTAATAVAASTNSGKHKRLKGPTPDRRMAETHVAQRTACALRRAPADLPLRVLGSLETAMAMPALAAAPSCRSAGHQEGVLRASLRIAKQIEHLL